MQTTNQLEAVKSLLSDAETAYAHAFARGDWKAVAPAKREVAKYRKMVGQLIVEITKTRGK